MYESILIVATWRWPRATLRLGVLLTFACCLPAPVLTAQIRSDENVVFFPTAARWNEDATQWIVPIHGWIYEPETGDPLRNSAVQSLRKSIGLEPTADEAKTLSARCRLFLVDNERDKRIEVKLGDSAYALEPSTVDGHFSGEIRLATDTAARLQKQGRIEFSALLMPGDQRRFIGTTLLVPARGISVISDIDDTIKISEVRDRRQLLQNTFLRPFRPVPGMAEAYRRWHEAGAVIHYVSSSPWQLFPVLDRFTKDTRFPDATFHLKRFRLKDSSWFDLFADPLTTKVPAIESLLRDFGQRQFVLVGDSGEQDPEVYGLIARKYPGRIQKIYIRDVTDEPRTAQRYRQAFRDVPADLWQLFTDASTLQLDMP